LPHGAVISYCSLHMCYITDEMSQKNGILVKTTMIYLCFLSEEHTLAYNFACTCNSVFL
jgi:hypothetical protein